LVSFAFLINFAEKILKTTACYGLLYSAFSVAGPVCWNSLPDYLKSSHLSFNCFRQQLKRFYFVNIDTSPSTTLVHRDIVDALYKSMILTYLQ